MFYCVVVENNKSSCRYSMCLHIRRITIFTLTCITYITTLHCRTHVNSDFVPTCGHLLPYSKDTISTHDMPTPHYCCGRVQRLHIIIQCNSTTTTFTNARAWWCRIRHRCCFKHLFITTRTSTPACTTLQRQMHV